MTGRRMGKSPPKDEVDGVADGGKSLEESWREVKRKAKPVVNKERKQTSLSCSGGAGGDYLEELAFQFEEDQGAEEYSARGRNFISNRN